MLFHLCNKQQKYIQFPALPFSRSTHSIKKPPISGFPWHPKTLGEKILRKRLELGLTQLEVAQKLGLNDQTVCRWEKGENNPRVKQYFKIMDFLNHNPFDANYNHGKVD
ncbi:MAG: helix-turn-helix transcriptional regulator [Chitinophagaceae bacterium]|nr:helix-turn-helix transcriptional regulator [Chitinophagaceae bacterium]